jgi:hypothetical protein
VEAINFVVTSAPRDADGGERVLDVTVYGNPPRASPLVLVLAMP